jgi:hypothetical protein
MGSGCSNCATKDEEGYQVDLNNQLANEIQPIQGESTRILN